MRVIISIFFISSSIFERCFGILGPGLESSAKKHSCVPGLGIWPEGCFSELVAGVTSSNEFRSLEDLLRIFLGAEGSYNVQFDV